MSVCASVRPSVVSPSTMLKDLLLQNRLANQSQILCGASLARGNDILFTASGSHDQDGRHAYSLNIFYCIFWQRGWATSSVNLSYSPSPIYAYIWSKPFKNLLLQNRQADFHKTWYVASGTPANHSLFK